MLDALALLPVPLFNIFASDAYHELAFRLITMLRARRVCMLYALIYIYK